MKLKEIRQGKKKIVPFKPGKGQTPTKHKKGKSMEHKPAKPQSKKKAMDSNQDAPVMRPSGDATPTNRADNELKYLLGRNRA